MKLKNNPRITIPVFGNGDVDTPQKVVEMKNRYGVDGIMIGRASIGYPWIFNQVKQYLAGNTSYPVPGIDERIEVCRTHLLKSVEWKGNVLGILEMRRHYTNYFKGMDHFRDYRVKLVTSNHLDELLETLELIKEKYSVVV
ncbi:MAG: tRNA-U20-dihydrouridine synthase [Bacteroidetes bacterium OLB10]|nr:MAG: tRNA-U20-dihydrouridine synthase [Bacteroidetes bacterium OLB10]